MWGPFEKGLIQVARMTKEIPRALRNKPNLATHLWPIWEAFVQISRSRQSGLSTSPLMVSEIKAWMDIQGFRSTEVRREYYDLIAALDVRYLQLMQERQTEGASSKK